MAIAITEALGEPTGGVAVDRQGDTVAPEVVEDSRDAILKNADRLGALKDGATAFWIKQSQRTSVVENFVGAHPQPFGKNLRPQVRSGQDGCIRVGRHDVRYWR